MNDESHERHETVSLNWKVVVAHVAAVRMLVEPTARRDAHEMLLAVHVASNQFLRTCPEDNSLTVPSDGECGRAFITRRTLNYTNISFVILSFGLK